jgi:hypothetical protein
MNSTLQNIAASTQASRKGASLIASRPSANALSVTALVLSSSVKALNPKFPVNTHTYEVLILATGPLASDVAYRAQGEDGFRLSHAKGTTNKDTIATYRTVNVTYNEAQLQGGDNGRTDRVIKRCMHKIPTGESARLSLATPLLSSCTNLVLCPGKVVFIDVKVGDKDVLIPRAKLVTIRGFTMEMFARLPLPKAASETVVGDEEGDDVAHSSSVDDYAHLRDTSTGNSLGFKFVGDVIMETAQDSYNKLPLEILLKKLFPLAKQQPQYFQPGQLGVPHKALVIPVDAKGLSDVTLEAGIIIGPNQPRRFIRETMTDLDSDNPQTYEGGKKNQSCLPVKASLVHFQQMKQDLKDEEVADMSKRFDTRTPMSDKPGFDLWHTTMPLDGMVWSEQTYASGYANHATWCDVNAQAPIPCLVVAQQATFPAPGAPLKVRTKAVGWFTKTYVLDNSFEIPLPFAKRILGDKDVVESNLDFGIETPPGKGKLAYKIENEVNKTRGQVDLLNATESNAVLAPYLDPANKWHARVQLIVNRADYLAAKERVQKSILADVETSRALRTPEEGQRFIEEYINSKKAGDVDLGEFGTNERVHRVVVWFVRRDEDVYDQALLDLPPFTDLSPAPAPVSAAASLKRSFESSLDEKSPDDMDLEGDEENAEAPAIKKARKE